MTITKTVYKTKKGRESISYTVTATNESLPDDGRFGMKESFDLWTLYDEEEKYARSFIKWAGVPDDLSSEFNEWREEEYDSSSRLSYGQFIKVNYPVITGIGIAAEMLAELHFFKLDHEKGNLDEASVRLIRASFYSRRLELLRHEDNIRARIEATNKASSKQIQDRKEYLSKVLELLKDDKDKKLRTGVIIKKIDIEPKSQRTLRRWINELLKKHPEYAYISKKGAPITPN